MSGLWINILPLLKKLRLFILDSLFPIHCVKCGTSDVWLCDSCLKKVKIRDQQFCPICEKRTTPDGRVCFSCKNNSDLNGMLVATSYRDPIISKTVHLFKYRFIEDLSKPLSEVILKTLRSSELPLPDLIIPIPLHPKRLRWRGFNQSEELANNVARNLLPGAELETVTDVLFRNRYTWPQMSIKKHSDRGQNVHGAFIVKDHSRIKRKKILLIDDIATTGATIFECCRILKESGAKEVYAAVIARQEYGDK